MLNLAWGSSNQSVAMYSYLRFYQRAKIGYLEMQSVYLEREDTLKYLVNNSLWQSLFQLIY